MRFGSVDMFIELGDWGFRMGRLIANEGFLKALLTYGSYGSYEFFCPDVYHMERFSKKVKDLIKDPQLLNRVKSSLQIALSEAIQLNKYDVFHLGDFTYFMPYLVDMRNRYAKDPFPITGVTHSLDAIYMNLRYLELVVAGLRPYDGIICTSHSAEQTVQKGLARVTEQLSVQAGISLKAESKLKQIPLGIDELYFIESDKSLARKYFNIPEDMIVALSVGRLSIRKKADWSPVLELLARMYASEKISKLIFLIAGGAKESEISLMESMISKLGLEEKVLLFPNFPSDVKTRLDKAADFYISIVDNFQETFGLNILEAMASGLPVISSDFSGYRDLVINEKNGFLIPTIWSEELPEFIKENLGIIDPSIARLYLSQTVAFDLEELQRRIVALYDNENLRTNMGLASMKRAKGYRWEKVIHSYEEFWTNLSQEAKNSKPKDFKKQMDILLGDFEKTFSHYPSRLIDNNSVVALTDVGRNALNGGGDFIKYEDISACLFPDLETFILNSLSEEKHPVAFVEQQAMDILLATKGQTRFHLLWFLKHGALKLESSPGKI